MRFFSDNAAAAHPKVIEAIAASNRLDTAYDGDEWSERLDGAFSDLFETEVRAFWVTTGTAANCLALAALCPPYRGILCHKDAHIEVDEAGAPGFFTGGAKLMLLDGPGPRSRPRPSPPSLRPHPQGRSPGPARRPLDHQRDRIWPRLPRRRSRGARASWRRSADSLSTWTARASPMRWRRPAKAPPTSPGAPGVDAMSFGFVKNGGLNAEALILFNTELGRRDRGPPQARRASAVQGPDARRADPRAARGRPVARQCARRQCRRAGARRGRGAIGWSIRSRRMSCSSRSAADEAAQPSCAGVRFLRLGPGRDPPGDQLGPAGRRRRAARGRARRSVTSRTRRPSGSVTLPFIIFTAIWGSTWIVIRGQLGDGRRRNGR